MEKEIDILKKQVSELSYAIMYLLEEKCGNSGYNWHRDFLLIQHDDLKQEKDPNNKFEDIESDFKESVDKL